jgi:hypothetical protein
MLLSYLPERVICNPRHRCQKEVTTQVKVSNLHNKKSGVMRSEFGADHSQ